MLNGKNNHRRTITLHARSTRMASVYMACLLITFAVSPWGRPRPLWTAFAIVATAMAALQRLRVALITDGATVSFRGVYHHRFDMRSDGESAYLGEDESGLFLANDESRSKVLPPVWTRRDLEEFCIHANIEWRPKVETSRKQSR